MSTIPLYISNGDTTGNINAAANRGWFQLPRTPSSVSTNVELIKCSVAFQIALAAAGSPIGLFIFEVTDDVDPTVNPILTPTALTLPTAMAAGQPTDGLARSFLFEFNPAPTAAWMRARYARTSGGSSAAGSLNVGVALRSL